MPILVRLPAVLRDGPSETLTITAPVRTVAELVELLDRRLPGFREQLEDSVFNFAVNDEMLLHGARERELKDGDVVEIVPTISGGAAVAGRPARRCRVDGHGESRHERPV